MTVAANGRVEFENPKSYATEQNAIRAVEKFLAKGYQRYVDNKTLNWVIIQQDGRYFPLMMIRMGAKDYPQPFMIAQHFNVWG